MSHNSTSFDSSLAATPGLTWLPWIGRDYDQQSSPNRLMIICESHYTNEPDEVKAREIIEKHHRSPNYTREIVQELGPDRDWENKTFNALHKTLFLTDAPDREAFWADVCCYNFVQRMLWYPPGDPERPTWEDFVQGWRVFLDLVTLLKPTHCLFVGIEAANHFNGFMAGQSLRFVPVELTEQVSRTWGRRARLEIEGVTTSLHFIQHSGKFFSWSGWYDYLQRHAPEMMTILANPAYKLPKTVAA